ncbi:MAG: hypothetical protein MAG795_01088 [Candidatus Woesearchaeota archaeon]|nr:hypothetical protein [Candidatus Woesearchaeota archaeon]
MAQPRVGAIPRPDPFAEMAQAMHDFGTLVKDKFHDFTHRVKAKLPKKQQTTIKQNIHPAVKVHNTVVSKAQQAHSWVTTWFTHLIKPLLIITFIGMILVTLFFTFRGSAYAMAENTLGSKALLKENGKVNWRKVGGVYIKSSVKNGITKLETIGDSVEARVMGTYTPTENKDTTEYGLKFNVISDRIEFQGNEDISVDIIVKPKLLDIENVEDTQAMTFCKLEDDDVDVVPENGKFHIRNDVTHFAACTFPHTISNKPTEPIIVTLAYPFTSFSSMQISYMSEQDYKELYNAINSQYNIENQDDLQTYFLKETGIDHDLYAESKLTPILAKAKLSGVQPIQKGREYKLIVTLKNRGEGTAYLKDLKIDVPQEFRIDNQYIQDRIYRGTSDQLGEVIESGSMGEIREGLKIKKEKEVYFFIPIEVTAMNNVIANKQFSTSRVDITADYNYVIAKRKLIKTQTCKDLLTNTEVELDDLTPEERQDLLDKLPDECKKYVGLGVAGVEPTDNVEQNQEEETTGEPT